MIEELKKLAKFGEGLTVEERNLLSVVFMHMIRPRINIWRRLSDIMHEEESGTNETIARRIINGYKLKMENGIIKICEGILPIIEEHLIPSTSTPDASVFYYTM